MSDYRELLLGCGHSRDKRMTPDPARQKFENLITLDNNMECEPDILCDLDTLYDWSPSWYRPGLEIALGDEEHFGSAPMRENLFDEVHAYEVLEHLGFQGNAAMYFNHFTQIWRILKPGGFLCATVPSRYSAWLWGDPSHRRCINEESLAFLDQDNYNQLDGARPTSMSDFRSIYSADFQICERQDNHKQFFFILRCVKPSRIRERKP